MKGSQTWKSGLGGSLLTVLSDQFTTDGLLIFSINETPIYGASINRSWATSFTVLRRQNLGFPQSTILSISTCGTLRTIRCQSVFGEYKYRSRDTSLPQSSNAIVTEDLLTSIAPLPTGAERNASAKGALEVPESRTSVDQRAIGLETALEDATRSQWDWMSRTQVMDCGWSKGMAKGRVSFEFWKFWSSRMEWRTSFFSLGSVQRVDIFPVWRE